MSLRKRIFLAALLLPLALLLRPVLFLAHVAWREHGYALPPLVQDRHADDVSRLEPQALRDIVRVGPGLVDALPQVRAALARARQEHLRISIAGARHSQGGHTLVKDGLQLDLTDLASVAYDPDTQRVRVGAGCRWDRVIQELDRHGHSVVVMQSDANFSVGGSLSVNCHGWQSGMAPIASTVASLTVMTADGRLHRCDREKNSELFRLVLGGYGLFGVILEAELETAPNLLLVGHSETLPLADYLPRLESWSHLGGAGRLAYGRLCIAPSKFLQEARLNVLLPQPGVPPALRPQDRGFWTRLFFRGELGSDYGKELRWDAERLLGGLLNGPASRNQVQSLNSADFTNRDPARTDILQEYFVPSQALGAFVQALATSVREHGTELLNVTVRDVQTDTDTALPYARGPRLALVLFFDQARTPEAEAKMQACTRDLIDAALDLGGTYYLPYRPHASQAQFLRAYPMARRFAAAKRRWDPQGIFSNKFYERYLRAL